MTTRHDIAAFVDYCESVRRLAPNTLRAYRTALSMYAETLALRHRSVRTATVDDVAAFCRSMQDRSAATVALRLAVVRQLHAYLQATGRSPLNPARLVPAPKIIDTRERRVLTVDEVRRVIRAARARRARDEVVVELLYRSMLRVGEARLVRVDAIDLERGIVEVVGKGRRARGAVLERETRAAILRYIDERVSTSPYLLRPAIATGRARGAALSRDCLAHVVADACLAAGTPIVTPHELRHAGAEHRRAAGCDPFTLARLLGHARLSTSSRYVHPPIEPADHSPPPHRRAYTSSASSTTRVATSFSFARARS